MASPFLDSPGAEQADTASGASDEVIRIPDLVPLGDSGSSPQNQGASLEIGLVEAAPRAGRLYAYGKRAFDMLVVVALSPLWFPLYALIAVTILALDGRPIHFRDQRVGKDGRELSVLKFRTMHSGAKNQLEALLKSTPSLQEEFDRFAKLRSDPRVTALGRRLRRSSLDELPQLFGILSGSMSLVGPRPLTRSEIVRFYQGPAIHVLSVRPGLTGLWQICGRSSLSLEQRVPLDLQYVRERSFGGDLLILLKTVPLVLRGHEAV